MSAITGQITQSISGVGANLNKTVSITAGGALVISEDIPANQTALALTCNIDISAMKAFYMVSSVDMTAAFYSSSTPHETFSLVANEPVVWNYLSQLTAPLVAADTTAVKITNTTAGTFNLQVLQDVTP